MSDFQTPRDPQKWAVRSSIALGFFGLLIGLSACRPTDKSIELNSVGFLGVVLLCTMLSILGWVYGRSVARLWNQQDAVNARRTDRFTKTLSYRLGRWFRAKFVNR
ncbi:MAG: hypothetical protein ACKV0T_01465 [Planctomycetales bacterium]